MSKSMKFDNSLHPDTVNKLPHFSLNVILIETDIYTEFLKKKML